MPLTTSSAGAIIYSVLLTKSAVIGHYEINPGILRGKICTQQSTWMETALEDGGGAAMALEDGSGEAVLGGGIGCWLKIAVAALVSGGGRRTCNDGVGVSVVKAKGLLYNISISIGKDGKRGCVQCKGRMPAAMARR
jgi:hypothetical protein